jgi:hypothetical protein
VKAAFEYLLQMEKMEKKLKSEKSLVEHSSIHESGNSTLNGQGYTEGIGRKNFPREKDFSPHPLLESWLIPVTKNRLTRERHTNLFSTNFT